MDLKKDTLTSVDMTVIIHDALGKEILRFTQNDRQKSIDVSTWARGIYHCSLYGNQQLLQTEKLILMK